MDKMFDSSFLYGVSSFPHTDTSSRVVIFQVRLVELLVRLAVFRSRLIASGVRLVILSVRFVGWPLRLVVLRVRLVTDHIGSSSFVVSLWRFIVSMCRFIVSTRRLSEAIIRLTLHEELLDSMHLYMRYLSITAPYQLKIHVVSFRRIRPELRE